MAAGNSYCLGIKSNDFFLKDNKKAFILWLNVPKVTAYKNPSLMGKSDASECNESSLSNCRVQLALSTRKDGMILEILLLILSETDIIYLIM